MAAARLRRLACGPRALIQAAYLAAPDLAEPLLEELGRRGAAVERWHGDLALSPDPPVQSAWAVNVWTAPRLIEAPTIGQAAMSLRAIQRNWGGYQVAHHRRAALITDRLPPLRPRPLHFPQAAPSGHLGAWTLLEPELVLASPSQTSPFINGMPAFEEDRMGPPSRAYLKLWEACTLLGAWPLPGETCLDLGASPGGWTWVAASLGASVMAVDKAPLAPSVASMPGVVWQEGSAFALDPAQHAPVDWLLSDVIAYPDRLLRLVRAWVGSGRASHIICSVKFQGETDHAAADAFAAIEGASLRHLWHNKHELTFCWSREAALHSLATPAPLVV